VRLSQSHIDRFHAKLGPEVNGCRLWRGSRDSQGYGRLNVAGIPQLAHRVAWVIAHGPIPEGMCVLHRCDNPPCANVDCLFLGTMADNTADMVAKRRWAPPPVAAGEENVTAILTEEKVREIRAAFARGRSKMGLGRDFGVSPTTIYDVVTGKTWRHV
jgi:hypothetical protein